MCKKAFTTIRDNSIVYLFNHIHWHQTANIYNWATTEMIDSLAVIVSGKLAISSLQGKFVILLILSFII